MTTTVQLVLLSVVLLSCVQTGITQCDVAMIREAVLEVLQPFMNETRAGLEAVRRDLEEHKIQTTSEVMGNAVLRSLLPYMNRIEDNLGNRVDESVSNLAGDLEEVNEKVCNLTRSVDMQLPIMMSDLTSLTETMATLNDTVEEHNQQTSDLRSSLQSLVTSNEALQRLDRNLSERMSNLGRYLEEISTKVVNLNDTQLVKKLNFKFAAINSNMTKELRAMRYQLEEHENQTTAELHFLHTSFQSCIDNTHTEQVTQRCAEMDILQSRMQSINASMREELKALGRQLEEHRNQTIYDLADLHTTLQFFISNPPIEVMSGAVLHRLRPYMIRIYGNLSESVSSLAGGLEETNEKVCNLTERVEIGMSTVKSVMTSLTETVTTVNDNHEEQKNLTATNLHTFIQSSIDYENRTTAIQSTHTDQLTQICSKMDAMDSRLDSLSSAMNRVNLTAVESQVEEHNYRVTSTLVALQTKQDTIDSKLDQLDSKQDELDMKVMSANSKLEHNLLSNVTKQLHDLAEYGDHHVRECGGEGWTHVVYLDMTDPNTSCPSGWQLNTRNSNRTCDIVNTGRISCDSVFFPVSGGAYTSVCGKIQGYQNGGTDAFEAYHNREATTIDSAYVSGVSLTHGSPRQHIWTFAAGITEVHPTRNDACPCDATVDISIPSFVGGDYFCESGANSESWSGFHPDDPLWDGKNCTSSSTCCSFNNPPYFTKQLPNPTTDDLEMRLCHFDGDNTPIEFIELYVMFDEQNVLTTVTKELQRTSDKLHENLAELERTLVSNVTQELQKISDILEENIGHISSHVCGGTGGWRRVAFLDMTDPNTTCPSGWQFTGNSKRTCDTGYGGALTCDSVFLPVSGGAYTSVCGTIRGYQHYVTSAFRPYDDGEVTTIDGAYVSGVSLTHGSPRQHIWTFAAGSAESEHTRDDACPCDATINIAIPPFVGEDYFCESGANLGTRNGFQADDPLWDGKGCTSSSTCCSFNNPPYFTKRLPNPTTDDLEVRMCQQYAITETPIEFIELYVKVDELNMRELEQKILTNVTKNLVMHEHNLLTNITKALQKTSDLIQEDIGDLSSHVCGGTGGWTRVAYLDMTDLNTNCPFGWQLTGHSKRTCGIVSTSGPTCDSVFFPVSGGAYTAVCGIIKGYQNSQTDAFEAYHNGRVTTIDGAYVCGVSLTHGSPRQHIWTFAAGASESYYTLVDACPCDATIDISIPPFVGGDYFCESATESQSFVDFYPDDPLWDGKNCTSSSTCCSFNNPPYFTKQLPNPTTDELEVRLCHLDGHYTPIEFMELYVRFEEHNVLTNITKELQKTSSNIHEDLVLHEHSMLTNMTKELQNTADFLHEYLRPICGGTGNLTRVAYLDMTNPNTNCPSGWQFTTRDSKRTCEIVNTGRLSCDSVFFPVSGKTYNRVCGTIRGYQYQHTDAFEAYHDGDATTIDSAYVSGVSLTHGSPRQHIWTFAAGGTESGPTNDDSCPCDATINIAIPPFVGRDYFCESGLNSGSSGDFYPYDPLWDGKNCTSSSTCCSFNNPPYFTKQLPNPTTDDIEVRICHLDGQHTPIEFIELFVEYEEHIHVNGDTTGWRRVAYLNMTDPNTNCPSDWQLKTAFSKRTCGIASASRLTCDSVFFPVSGAYSRVLGTITGYQIGHTDAFEAYHDGSAATIDSAYVSGVSLTHGSPRQHIWTFAASPSSTSTNIEACPCNSTAYNSAPPFVGGDYFCESGRNAGSTGAEDPLWDGDSCAISTTCCPFNNPPYFTKQLPNPTTDDLEVRLCRYSSGEDTPIEFMELYVMLDMKEYNILTNITKELQKTSRSVIELLGHACGGTFGWKRLVYLNMTDSSTNCPSGWQLTGNSKRTCGKVTGGLTCDSVLFPVSGGIDYTSVCGRVKGYQYSRTDAFEAYHDGRATTIDSAYVSGVSLTHGSPRQHIWTFAASATSTSTNIEACPCNSTSYNSAPPFVGGDYFCESGANSGSTGPFYADDPLWDGDSCAVSNACCPFNNPPYFTKKLPNPTTDDLEVRLCRLESGDDTPIEFIELYIK